MDNLFEQFIKERRYIRNLAESTLGGTSAGAIKHLSSWCVLKVGTEDVHRSLQVERFEQSRRRVAGLEAD